MDKDSTLNTKSLPLESRDPSVLFEDNHQMVTFKPAGWLTQPDGSRRECLWDWAKDKIRARKEEEKGRVGNVYLGLVQRLDRPVSGLVVFAKTSKGASRLCAQFRASIPSKRYWALVEGRFEHPRGELRHFLATKDSGQVTVSSKVDPTGRESVLRYQVIKQLSDTALLDIDLITGRKHQIRAQLADIGHPIVGDGLYGASVPCRDWVALTAYTLTLDPILRGSEGKLSGVHVSLPWSWVQWRNLVGDVGVFRP